jgi:hypothetical protein
MLTYGRCSNGRLWISLGGFRRRVVGDGAEGVRADVFDGEGMDFR